MKRGSVANTCGPGVFFCAMALLASETLLAQENRGKVQGRVVAEASGAPIAGASVSVLGTSIANVTNEAGYYFLNEVPAGLQTVRAEFIGYRPVEIANERVLAGQTTTLDLSLSPSAIEMEALVVEGERNPLVPRDQTSTKSIVTGETIDQLPLDNTAGIVVLQAGVVETNRGRTIRGGRPNEEALIVDGVLARSFGSGRAANIELPTNALEQVDVNVGGFSAEFGESQSGIVSYVTRSGGTVLTGSLELLTDELSPDRMRTNFNRGELTLGGPIAGPLTFFLAGTAEGQHAFTTTDGPARHVIDGNEICPTAPQFAGLCVPGEVATFRLPRASAAETATDSVDVTAPNFVAWDDGRTVPNSWGQLDLFHGNANWALPRGSRLNFSYNRNRRQDYGYAPANFADLYRYDGIDGARSTRNSVALTWFQTVTQTAEQQLAFDLLAAYAKDSGTIGMLDQAWFQQHKDPWLGFMLEDLEFGFADVTTVTGFDLLDPSEAFVNAFRSNALPQDSLTLLPDRMDLTSASQSLLGLVDNLRSNPYGMNRAFPLAGTGLGGIRRNGESRLHLRAGADWQIGRFNRLKVGAEYIDISLWAHTLWLGPPPPGLRPMIERAEPTKLGVFVQERLDLGDLVLEAGVRWDYLKPDVELPRTPGYVYNVPDSLKAGFVRYDATSGTYLPLEMPCNGAPVCKSNFIAASTKSELSPRVGVAFPVTPRSTFRLSYGRFVQAPAFFTTTSFFVGPIGAAEGTAGFLENVNLDLLNGGQGSATFARDVDMPATHTFEFGYRQLIARDFVVDLSAFNKKQRGALTSRRLPFEDPNNGATSFLSVLTNQDYTESIGFEIKIDKAVGNLITSNLSYSYLDARGTGSDPFFYDQLIRRASTNLSAVTFEPPNPPAVLLRLEQSRKHSISWTGSLVFPGDFRDGSVAGALLGDLGLFTILRMRSGLPYTKVRNRGGGIVGPPSQLGTPESTISGAETPWTVDLDLRLTKTLGIGRGLTLQAFVDWRNPFDIENTRVVFLETGNTVNALHRRNWLGNSLQDPLLDGSSDIDDFDVRAESPENPFNMYMLLRAEQRWGNGDGIFTVEEQERAFGQLYEANFGVKSRFELSDQELRLGLRLAF